MTTDPTIATRETVDVRNVEEADKKNYYSDGTSARRSLTYISPSNCVKNKVDKRLHKSRSMSMLGVQRLPTFHLEELELDKLLGSGSFSEVYEIVSIKILHKSQDGLEMVKSSLLDDVEVDIKSIASFDSLEEQQFHYEKEFIAKNCIRPSTGDARFAIKYLSQHIVEDNATCAIGATDLAMEVMTLSNLYHPNIVELRGVSATGFDDIGSMQGYFIILDRLHDTVEQKLPKWKAEVSKLNPLMRKEHKVHLAKRLIAAFDIASALLYLHDQDIMYRDLKLQNVGFDARGDIKIFDFGLARELKEEDRMSDGTYRLTGNTGTRRYMAPEVALEKCYNLSADVYSFSIVLWEICALKKAFKDYTYENHYNYVILGDTRPSKKIHWSSSIKELLTSMWSKKPSHRPDFRHILHILEEYISKYIDRKCHSAEHRQSSFLG